MAGGAGEGAGEDSTGACVKKPAKEELTPADLNKMFSTWKGATIRIKYPENETVESAALVFATQRGVAWAGTNYGQPAPSGEPIPWYSDRDGLFEADGAGFLFRDRVGAIYHLREFADCDGSDLAAKVARFERWLEGEGRSWPDAWQRVHQYLLDVAALRIEEVPPEYVSYRKELDAFVARVSRMLPNVLSRVGRERLAAFAYGVSKRSAKSAQLTQSQRKNAQQVLNASTEFKKALDQMISELPPHASPSLGRCSDDLGTMLSRLDRQIDTDLGVSRSRVSVGRKRAFWHRYLTEWVWREFGAEGLPRGHESEAMLDACATLYVEAGLEERSMSTFIKGLNSNERSRNASHSQGSNAN